ncbi:VTT domain-containing protein [Comamonadaceae bacterium BS-T2-15]|uniref:VTT domain-containing protein n=2 Tax=Scleromatobacter humisilvae TaxID=2897159 RepID=A0A9X1YL20_9BURK|nr:VTT domain-containing protein [Scleromatobacter humisilvae]MCK9688524.1 VTT domain-containing protein [Scleromatobacter humisilvae]
MDSMIPLFQHLLHADQYLAAFVAANGLWVYAVLFAVIFIETGVVVMPFLPGDSLLFVVGATAATGLLDITMALGVMFAAAVLGNQTNYTIGRWFGPRVFHWENSRWFSKDGFDKAHAFYEKYGGVALIAGRFMPFVRTFAPFVAGVTMMTRRRFTLYDVTGAALWIGSVTLLGWGIGNLPWVKTHLQWIFLSMIIIPGVLALFGVLRKKTQAA